MRLSDALHIPRGLTATVGGGGKTSLIWRLAQELSASDRVLLATTTHIRAPACRVLLSPTRADVLTALESAGIVAIGDPAVDGKLMEAKALGGDYAGLAEYVLIEADGSRGLPLKAPDIHEPVLPRGAALTVAVAGMSCAGLTIAEAAHRPALYATLAGADQDAPVTPRMVAKVLMDINGQRKHVAGRYAVVLSQADTSRRRDFAREVAAHLEGEAVIVALQTNPEWMECWCGGKQQSNV